jgi:signal peptide peptidase SppA
MNQNLQLLLSLATQPMAMERHRLQALLRLAAMRAMHLPQAEAGQLQAALTPRQDLKVQQAEGAVAILPIYGILAQRMSFIEELFTGGTSVEKLQAVFRGLVADDQVKAIVLNFDTPGGYSVGVDEFAQEILEARGAKPIIAQIDSCAASAGYWLASAAEEIVITPGGQVGSVGVYAVHEEMSRLFEELGITYTLISSGGLKGTDQDFLPLSEELRAEIQKSVDYTDAMFKKTVAAGRGITAAAVSENYGDGKMFMPKEAKALGIVDKIAPLKDTLARLGVSAPAIQRRQSRAAVRAAAAAGDFTDLHPSVLEDAMREAFGFSKKQATALASHGLKILRQGDPGEDRGDPGQAAENQSAAELIAAVRRSAGSFLKT